MMDRSLAIAEIVDDNNECVGVRVLTLYGPQSITPKHVINLGLNETYKAISHGQIENLNKYRTGIQCNNGSIERMPKISELGVLIGKPAFTILCIIEKYSYVVADFQGNISRIPEYKAIEYGKIYGIANGKISHRGKKEFISPIAGSYPEYKENMKDMFLNVDQLSIDNMDTSHVADLSNIFINAKDTKLDK